MAEGVDAGVRTAFETSLDGLREHGAILEDVELPHSRYGTATYAVVVMAEASSNLGRFDGVRYTWRRFQARLHGHEHVEPLEMSSYGPRSSFGVGMIHGVGAETGSQVLLIAAVGGASSAGLGIPMLFAFVAGLLVSNFGIVILTSTGFVASQTRERIYVAVGLVAGLFSLTLGLIYVFGMDAIIPEMDSILPF